MKRNRSFNKIQLLALIFISSSGFLQSIYYQTTVSTGTQTAITATIFPNDDYLLPTEIFWGEDHNQFGESVICDSEQNIIVGGYSSGFALVLKYDSSGIHLSFYIPGVLKLIMK